MVDCYLVHRDVHYRTVVSLAMVLSVEIRLAYVRRAAASTPDSNDATAVFLLYLFARLENRRQQTLILHKRTIMVVFSNVTYPSCHRTGDIILKVTVERLVLAVVNF